MACGRHDRRSLLLLVAILVLAPAAGCLRPSFLRPASEPVLERQDLSDPDADARDRLILPASNAPVPVQAEKPSPLDSPANGLATPLTSVPTPAFPEPGPTPVTVAVNSGTSTPPPPGPNLELTSAKSPARSTTPLLDAAIQRVEAVTRQERESSSPGESREKPKPPPPPVAAPSPSTAAGPAKTANPQEPLPLVLDLSTQSSFSTATATPRRAAKSPTEDHAGPLSALSEPRLDRTKSTHSSGQSEQPAAPSKEPTPTQVSDERDEPLCVANLQLCREVHGFGSFEPLIETTLKPGLRVLLYSEMTGVRYLATDAGYASRLSSRVELRAAGSETIVWEQDLGIAKDECRRVRRDYFVSYGFLLPRSLAAGPYRLRIVQTEPGTDRSASLEIPVTIAP
jgi:hypothetical protein